MSDEPMKKCPMCGEMVLAEARKCRHCHTLLFPEEERAVTNWRRVVAYIVACVLFILALRFVMPHVIVWLTFR